MKIHNLKIQSRFFEDVEKNKKKFEIRKNDRDFKHGDIIVLKEINKNNIYTGREVERKITYITDYEQKEGFVVLGIE